MTGLEAIARELQAAGLAAATPAALVHRVTCPQQQVWFSTLADLPETARRHAVKPPALLVIGEVVRLAAQWPAGQHQKEEQIQGA